MSGPIPLSARQLMTPPSTPKKRRRMLRESEDSSGNLTIEQYLYRSDAFRCTTLEAPFPLPVDRTSLPPNGLPQVLENLLPHIRAEIGRLIKDQFTAHFVNVTKPGYPDGNVKRLTLAVKIYKGREEPTTWTKARSTLKNFLIKAGYPSIDVEIVDESRAFSPSVFPQSSKVPSTKAYESVRDNITGLLVKYLGWNWTCMSLFSVGSSTEDSVPSIVVFVKPYTSSDWQSLYRMIKQTVAPKIPPGKDLGLEFLPGKYSNPAGKDLDGSHLLRQKTSALSMGSSIGIQGDDSSGTLGGFATLKVGSRTHHGFITCHHVVQPVHDKQMAAHLSRKGFEYSLDLRGRPMIQWPSPEDLAATRKGMLRSIDLCSERVKDAREKQETRLMRGQDKLPRLEEVYQRDLKVMNDFQHRLKTIDETLPVDLGYPLVSSGNLVTPNHAILDWAFVEALPSLQNFVGPKFPVNELPYRDDPQITAKPYLGSQAYTAPTIGDPPMVAFEFGKIVKDGWYFKKGRTSSITSGICNGTECEINRTGEMRYTETGDLYKLGKNTTRELIILSYQKIVDGVRQGEFQDTFSLPGDSGSFVIDQFGAVCGILYGEHSGLCGPAGREDREAGLVTSMDDVLASIAKKTARKDGKGGEVRGQLGLPSRH